MSFNPFYDKYISPKTRGVKRKGPDYEVPSSYPVKKRKLSQYTVPSDSPALTNRIIKSIQGELKGMDTSINQVGVLATTNTNGNIETLNLIQTGNGSWNRVGRKTHLKSVRLQGVLLNTMALTNGDWVGNSVRLLLVWDQQPSSGTLPLYSDIFGVTSQTGVETTAVLDPPKYDNMDRFRVLKDWREDFVPQAQVPSNTDTVTEYRQIDCYLALKELESVYSGQSNPMTIADISTGALYFIARAVNNAATTSTANIVMNARVRYSDK